MLDHPVRRRLAQTLSIFVYNRFLVIVRFCIVDESLAIALDLGETGVTPCLEFVLEYHTSVYCSQNSIAMY